MGRGQHGTGNAASAFGGMTRLEENRNLEEENDAGGARKTEQMRRPARREDRAFIPGPLNASA